jgi:hypothetical protein
MSTKEKIYKRTNTIEELSKLLSDRIWSDESIKDQFILAALADGIHSAATELDDLAHRLVDPNDNNQQALDQENGATG